MIERILQMLALSDHYGQSDYIDIAKGKYKIPQTLEEAIKQQKRWRKRP